MTDGPPTPALSEADRRFRALNWIAIVDQLATTKANRMLDAIDLPMPQFTVLNHFAHRPREPRTVGGIAAAFQQPQPGVTKTVQKLLDKGYLEAEPDSRDGRVKRLRLTPTGSAAHEAARQRLAPDIAAVFTGWREQELETLLGLLDRLKTYLDRERDPA
jgi:DNA-binding MarR family transcriptional regulator